MTGSIRGSPIAGSWYPGEPREIVREVEDYLGRVEPRSLPGHLVALVSPHAGLRYSGPVAAHGYALLRGRRGLTAVLVGPSHFVAFRGVSVFPRGGFETPLGTAPIDEDLVTALIAAAPVVTAQTAPHEDEHSLEMQLPFLQHLVADLRIVPVLMGSQTREDVDSLALALETAVRASRASVLLVASSDLSHYHPAAVANRKDALVVSDVERFDDAGLMARLEADHGHACGGGPMVAVMKAARGLGADRATVLRYADSGDAGERDKSRVVGYLSAALTAAAL